MNPLSLIKQGLLAAGHNFDRNAAGDLPSIMGSDFTPDVRRRARANAIMAIGQSLAGQKPMAEGLRGGQEAMLQGWAAKQQIAQQRRAQEAMAQAQGALGADPSAGGVPSPELLFNRAQQYERAGAAMMAAGQESRAKVYYDQAQNLRQRAAEMIPKNSGVPQTVMGPDGKPVLIQPMSTGAPQPVQGFGPVPNYTPVDTGGGVRFVDKNAPPTDLIPKTMTPGEQATTQLGRDSLDWRNWQFMQTLPIQQQNAKSQEMSASAASRNAATSAAREQREAGVPRPMSGDGAKVLAVATTMQPEIDLLINAFEQNGRNALLAIKTGRSPQLTRLVESVADKVGRLRSGGAINKDEESRFMGQIVRWADIVNGGSTAAVDALRRLKEEARSVEQKMNPSPARQNDWLDSFQEDK